MKLWGGRFLKTTDELVEDFNSSISFDKKLYKYDILGSIAHVKMLGKQKIILMSESKVIEKTLIEILKDIENGNTSFIVSSEDIHMNIENILIERIGEIGKKLHTGRSRNDQVALDTRMYVKDNINEVQGLLIQLFKTLIKISKNNLDTIMPGYTHMQKAQPITFSHHLLAYFEMFKRDFQRLNDTFKRTNILPLGSGALASTTYSLDREFVAKELNFDSISLNSLDAVSDRDFVIEFISSLSLIMMHLSRFCEEIILWCSDEFNFIELDDAYSTGSSIMPQKKNPDVAELIRGKTGRVYGDLISILTVMKSLPMAYNKDMQEDKEGLFDAVDTVKTSLQVFNNMLDTIKINKKKMRLSAARGFTNATDAADWLVKKGVPFRDAHAIIGKLVLYCIQNNTVIENISIDRLKNISSYFDESIYKAIKLEECVEQRKIIGGTSKDSILYTIEINKQFIYDAEKSIR